MANRQVLVYICNGLPVDLIATSGSRIEGGAWTSLPPSIISSKTWGCFQAESDGLMTGTQGEATYKADTAKAHKLGLFFDKDGNPYPDEIIHFRWDNPWIWDSSTRTRLGDSTIDTGLGTFSGVTSGGGDINPIGNTMAVLARRFGVLPDNAIETWPDGWAQVGLPLPIPDDHVAHAVVWFVIGLPPPLPGSQGQDFSFPNVPPPVSIGGSPVRNELVSQWSGDWFSDKVGIRVSMTGLPDDGRLSNSISQVAKAQSSNARLEVNEPDKSYSSENTHPIVKEGQVAEFAGPINPYLEGQFSQEIAPAISRQVIAPAISRQVIAVTSQGSMQAKSAIHRMSKQAGTTSVVSTTSAVQSNASAPAVASLSIDTVDFIQANEVSALYLYQETLSNGTKGDFVVRYRRDTKDGNCKVDVFLKKVIVIN